MLFRKRDGGTEHGAGSDPATGTPGVSHSGNFDAAASDRTLAACANIVAWCGTAIDETSAAAAPFLTVQQRAWMRGQATNFEVTGYQGGAIVQQQPAPTPVIQEQPAAPSGDLLSREEVDSIASHRVDITLQETLAQLGFAPGATIKHEVERQVEVQLATQEHRLLEYVKRHLTDSLKTLEASLSERLGEVLEGKTELAAAKAEVDAQVEGAREALLRQIEEVRTVDVGFNIDSYAADLAGIANVEVDEDDSVLELADVELELAIGGEEEEIAIGSAADEQTAEDELAAQSRLREEALAAKKKAEDDKVAAKKKAEDDKAAAKKKAADDKAAAKKKAADDKAAAKKAADDKAAAKKAADDKAAAKKAADDKAAAEKAAAAAAAQAKTAERKTAVAQVTADEDNIEISVRPTPGQDMAEIYLDARAKQSPDGDSDDDGASLELDEGADQPQPSGDEVAAAVAHYVSEGDRAVSKNRFGAAVTSYDSAIKVSPETAELYFKRGLAHRKDGNNKKAFLDLMKARDLDSDLPDIRKHLTEVRRALSETNRGSSGAKK